MSGGRIRYGYGYPLKAGIDGFSTLTQLIDSYVAYIQRANADGAIVFPFIPCLFHRYARIRVPSIDNATAIYDAYNVRATLDGAVPLRLPNYVCKKQKFTSILNS
jgi:hypothetical protein